MKNLIIRCITWYQKAPFSSHKMCRYTPTCSEYAKQAIESFGVVKGSFLAIKRILRCNPFGSYGYDPIPLKELKK